MCPSNGVFISTREYLSKTYAFECGCDVCTLPEPALKASDDRLSRIRDQYEFLKKWGSKAIDGVEAINAVRRIWSLMEAEGYLSERGQLAADAAWIAAAHGECVA